MTQAETSKLLKVVPERDGHRVELQWAVPPESKAYKVFPCTYLRYQSCRYISYYRHNVYFYISILVYSCMYFHISIYMFSALICISLYIPPPAPPSLLFMYIFSIFYISFLNLHVLSLGLIRGSQVVVYSYSHCLGHEGQGSEYATPKQVGWVPFLSLGEKRDSSVIH